MTMKAKHGKDSAGSKKCKKYLGENRRARNKARKIAATERFKAKKAQEKRRNNHADMDNG